MNSTTTKNNRKKCLGITRKGVQCRNIALENRDYCIFHASQENKKPCWFGLGRMIALILAMATLLGGTTAYLDLQERISYAKSDEPFGLSVGFMATESLADRINIGPEISMEPRVSQTIHIGWINTSDSQACFSLPWNIVNFTDTRVKDVNVTFEFRVSENPILLSKPKAGLITEDLICELKTESSDPRGRTTIDRIIDNRDGMALVAYTLSEVRPKEPSVLHIPIKLAPTVKLYVSDDSDRVLHAHYIDMSVQTLADDIPEKRYDIRLFLHEVNSFAELIVQEQLLSSALSIDALEQRSLWDNLVVQLASMTDTLRILGAQEQEALVLFPEPVRMGYDLNGTHTRVFRSSHQAYDHASVVMPNGKGWWSPIDGKAEDALQVTKKVYERMFDIALDSIEQVENQIPNKAIHLQP